MWDVEQQYRLPEIEAPAVIASALSTPVAGEAQLKIYCLGRFSIVRNGLPLRYTRKAPNKPLLLLKALIAQGGRQIASINLASLLWSDKEGDRAQQALETTLHRLRKYLGDDRYILMEDGRLTLNSALVWVDLWEFERSAGEIRRNLYRFRQRGKLANIHAHAERVLDIYQGHFLSREETSCWSVSLQERLRSKYTHCIIELGGFWEQHGFPDKAIVCYQKGIEMDDLIETFYQRLMVCYSETGRLPEALATYRQCKRVLSVVLGLQPTDETRRIHQAVQLQYRKKAG